MRTGKLDRVIRIDTYSAGVPDEYGTVQPGYVELATMRAQIIQASTEEFQRAYGASGETAIIFRTHFVEGVSTNDRIVYEGANFNVKEVKEIGRRAGLELRCIALGEA